MSSLTVLFVVLAVVLTVPVYAFAVRRLLGLRLSQWGRGVGAVDLSDGFAEALREELDLRIEAQNMTAVRAAAAAGGANGSVRIPTPHQSLCTANVLVMERLEFRPGAN